MCRERFLRPRWVTYGLIVWGIFVCLVPSPALAAPLPSHSAHGRDGAELAELREALESRVVRERLRELGISPEEAQARLASLSPDEVHELAARSQEVQAGGNAAEVIAVVLLAVLLFILIMELLGRRVISRG